MIPEIGDGGLSSQMLCTLHLKTIPHSITVAELPELSVAIVTIQQYRICQELFGYKLVGVYRVSTG